MNEIDMSKSQAMRSLHKEKIYLRNCEEQLLNIKSNIRCTKNAIKMWEKYIKKNWGSI